MHTVSIYNDIKHSIPKLRELYATSVLSIRPKIKQSKILQLKLIIEAWGMDPHQILSRRDLSTPHRTLVDAEQAQIQVLNQALKQAIVKELQGSA